MNIQTRRRSGLPNKKKNRIKEQLVEAFRSIQRSKPQDRYSHQLKNFVCKALEQGLRNCEISRITNVSSATISRWRREISRDNNQRRNSIEGPLNRDKISPLLRVKKSKIDSNAREDMGGNTIRILPVKESSENMLSTEPFFILKLGKLNLELNFKWEN